jgi:hypothetical protein
LNTELQGENKTIIKMNGTNGAFKARPQLWKTQLTKDVLSHFPSVESHTDSTFDASVYTLYTVKTIKEV